MADTKYKPLILISGLLVAALGGYYLYQTKFKKKQEVDDESEPEITPAQITPSPVVPKNTTPKPKTLAIGPAQVRPPGFAVPKAGPQSAAVKTPKIGDNLWVMGNGANAYKTAQASQGSIYKYYPKGAFMGTYLGKSGTFSKLIVEETGLFGNRTNVQVYARSSDIYVK